MEYLDGRQNELKFLLSFGWVLTVDFQCRLAFGRAHVIGSLHSELASQATTRAADGATVKPVGILKEISKNQELCIRKKDGQSRNFMGTERESRESSRC